MRKGWRRVALEDVADVRTGLALGKREVKAPIERPYLRVANVQDGYLDLSVIKTVMVSQSDVERYSLRRHDVLLTEGGDFDKLGRGTVWRDEVPDCLHQNHVFAVRVDAKRLCPFFLAFLTASPAGKRYFISSSKQSTNLASINSTQLKQFPVVLPPLSEQRRIADILLTWDEAIEKADELIEAKEKRLTALVGELLSGTNPRRELRASEWKIISFADLFAESGDLNPGLGPESVVTVGKHAIRLQLEHFNRSVASRDLNNYLLLRPGDFVYDPMSVYYGAIGRYEGRSVGIVSPAYRVLRLLGDHDPHFVHLLLKSHYVAHELEARSSQGNREGKRRLIRRDEFASIEVRMPPKSFQQAVSARANEFTRELNLTRSLRDALAKQKRGLMQKLLTGEWTVKVPQSQEAAE